jgi:zinc finger protein CreA/MIG
MDELYLLEQEEAHRRAEYETRRAEALRRAECQSRKSQVAPSAFYPRPRYRLSKSATTSPIMTNALTLGSAPSSVFPLSTDQYSYPLPSTESTRPNSKRRLSGPAWPSPPPQLHKDSPLTQSRSSGHLVDSMRASTFNYHHGTWSRPYQPHQNHRQEAVNDKTDGSHAQQHDDSPSPISSDSEHLGHDGLHKTHSPPKMFHLHGPSAFQSAHVPNRSLDSYSPPLHPSSAVRSTPSSDFAFTPSTSPFLGPLRTLNIHSATPSRAPSPILLPPGHGDEAARMPHSRAGSVAYGSPPLTSNSFVHRKQQHRRGDGHPGSSPHYGCVSSQLPPSMPRNTSWSASSSGSWQGLPSIQHHQQHSLYNQQHQRVNPSLPCSRSGSPPIRLPPLKMLPTDGSTATLSNLAPHPSHSLLMEDPTENPSDSVSTDQQQMLLMKKEKVELPGFSEFEAAARGSSSSAPTTISADARMSIDFVR